MATAHQIRDLINETTTGTVRPRVPREGRPEVGLVRFLADPKIPLDTNSVERALRGVAVVRKNHYGSRSELGTQVAALFHSLIESAELCGVEPRAYLPDALPMPSGIPGPSRSRATSDPRKPERNPRLLYVVEVFRTRETLG